MGKSRLEAFSDGVIAIIITIMVLELKAPLDSNLRALMPLIPTLMCYVLSFVFVGIYWNNHHHMLQVATKVNGRILWANQHLLFWLSLIPFVTSWMGQNKFAPLTVALYGTVMFFSGFAYKILSDSLIKLHEKDSQLGLALKDGRKGQLSLFIYLVAIPLSFVSSWLAFALYAFVAMIWLIPDRKIEKIIFGENP